MPERSRQPSMFSATNIVPGEPGPMHAPETPTRTPNEPPIQPPPTTPIHPQEKPMPTQPHEQPTPVPPHEQPTRPQRMGA